MKESRCERCGEITAKYPDGGGIVIPSSGHYCKGTVGRAERDLVRVIGWPKFNTLKAAGSTQELTKRMAALERLWNAAKNHPWHHWVVATNDFESAMDEMAELEAIDE